MTDDRRCTYTWENHYNETLRCMLDEGHSMFNGHRHGIQSYGARYREPLLVKGLDDAIIS